MSAFISSCAISFHFSYLACSYSCSLAFMFVRLVSNYLLRGAGGCVKMASECKLKYGDGAPRVVVCGGLGLGGLTPATTIFDKFYSA